MQAAPLVMTCNPADWDAQTAQCANPVWAAQPTLFPLLTPEEGALYGVCVVAVWAIGFGISAMRRVL